MTTVHDFSAKTIDGEDKSLRDYAGEVLLIVNTASRCGFTPQYEGLETLQKDLGERGFHVLGFPCNQFAGQEPGDDSAIKSFCELSYHTTFPLFAKVNVNGKDAHPLYEHLKSAAPGVLGSRAIKWNFTKFLVGRDGKVLRRYAPKVTPEALREDIESLLEVDRAAARQPLAAG